MTRPTTLAPTSLDGLNVPLYERVRLGIQARLAGHVWDPSEPIPTEQALAQEYEVSIGTIRKAVERLVKDGLLAKVQGKGTFIKRPDFGGSLLRFFRYRNASGQQVVPTGVVKAVVVVPADADINARLDLAPDAELIRLTRVRLVDETIVLSESIWLPRTLFAPLATMAPERFGNLLYPFYDEVCGQFVFSADETLSFTSGRADADLGTQDSDLLVRIERIAYNIEGRPIEYRISHGQPQNFRYEMRIR
ncbi:GntR family transcriptional regulator [Castellaniella sp. MT123]|uniref:GntR family transcriptional regulator n=1 Tax=Castellaniella sp. MT123 TaxID=3140381 RepID=UPI0031F3FD7A